MTALPSFDEFYTALHGRPPFPWQRRLARDVLAQGWPDVLDLPTGVGKTSALDVALYCLAAAPARMPRRVVLVVDRRIVVDQGAQHARAIQQAMTTPSNGALAAVAAALRRLWRGDDRDAPFAVAVMRGGMPRDNDWARRPDQPLLGVSTVDQVGSRLLFRGYGVSPRTASIHAGLLGNDTLILLDEVHLANAFAETLGAIRARYRNAAAALPDRFVVVQMSATVRAPKAATRTFRLDEEDRADPTIAVRLRASKRALLRTVKVTGDDEARKLGVVAERAVQEALKRQADGARVVAIVVNRVDTARVARQLLAVHASTTDAVLVTGRMRPIERDHVVARTVLPRVGAGRHRSDTDGRLIVVATQCIEAGADLDFDAMVTECASLDALRQRFGRVDRQGALKTSTSIVLGRSDQIDDSADDPVYGAALANTWQWLVAHASDDAIDFGIASLPAAKDAAGHPRLDLLPRPIRAPVLLPAHLDGWAQTSQPPAADADVALWLHGNVNSSPDVQLVWRVDADLGAMDEQTLIDWLQLCRPSSLESVTVPLSAARRWFDRIAAPAVADVEGEAQSQSRPAREPPKASMVALCWRGDDSRVVQRGDDLRPGDVVVLQRGGLRDASFDPASTDPVGDLGDLAQLRGRGIATLRLRREALAVWRLPEPMLASIPAFVDDESAADRRARVKAWLAQWPETMPEAFIGKETEWRVMARLSRSRRVRVAVVNRQLLVTAPSALVPEIADAVTEDDDSSFRQDEVTLAAHSTDVRALVSAYAHSIGFDQAVEEDLALAGWVHDVGKADPRFQRWLVGGSEVSAATHDELLAKSALPPGNAALRRTARERAGYPAGCRHELLSLAMVQGNDVLRDAHDLDLVLHLVASHHGWCRPLPPAVSDPQAIDVHMRHGDADLRATTQHQLGRLDSGVSDRFWRLVAKYGWWGLAWLESVMRLADHRASESRSGGVP